MRISFDLDDTLICYGQNMPCERHLPLLLRLFIRDEPLRKGTPELIRALRERNHEIWIYTSSGRTARHLRWWFRLHGVRIDDVVNSARHAKCFGLNSLPTKRPHAFQIDLHVDDSEGVAIEGAQHGFSVLLLDPKAEDWVGRVLAGVDAHEQSAAK